MKQIFRHGARVTIISLVMAMALTATAFGAEYKLGAVKGSSVNLRVGPSTSGKTLTQVDTGDQVIVLSQQGEWVQVIFEDTLGYIFQPYVEVSADTSFVAEPGTVTGSDVNFRKAPSTSAQVITRLDKGKQVEVLGVSNSWYKVYADGEVGYIHPDYLSVDKDALAARGLDVPQEKEVAPAVDASDKDALRKEIVAYAQTFLGNKYVYGAMNGKTFDCSGFTSWVYTHFGYSLNRSAAGQVSNGTKIESRSELKPGDLVLFRDPSINKAAASHVGLYVGDGKFIHCSSSGGGVKYNYLSDSYYNRYYIGGRRIVG
ncbi:MAG: SH3 domain-containing protein [Oscillospiraceae bacterium]|jgi:uncharacterized protein YgiM (DUF1202 family)|nr:SH3 domain-containing protein [Oscillospiraceae bacterium]